MQRSIPAAKRIALHFLSEAWSPTQERSSGDDATTSLAFFPNHTYFLPKTAMSSAFSPGTASVFQMGQGMRWQPLSPAENSNSA